MQRILTLAAGVLGFALFAFADTYSGALVDAKCLDQQKESTASCTPTASTTAFALQVSGGKAYRLDADGNAKAAQALQQSSSSADRAKDANAATQVMATVDGSLSGEELKVNTIQIK